MHFFNPAPIMKLVEVVRRATSEAVRRPRGRHRRLMGQAGRARRADTPGFIVNRVARPYYLEARHRRWTRHPGFHRRHESARRIPHGPLELTDFIGHDVNTATTRTCGTSGTSARSPRVGCRNHWWPKDTLVASPDEVYDHTGDAPICAVKVAGPDSTVNDVEKSACTAFTEAATNADHGLLQTIIFARILGALINEAMWAERGVAPRPTCTAVQYGSTTRGLLEWRDAIGHEQVSLCCRRSMIHG